MNIGIVCNNIGPNQLAYYAIKSGNKFVEKGEHDLIIFFYELMPECLRPNFAIMNLSEAYNYNGVLIATDLNSASRISEYPGTTNKYFYVWDLEWLRIQQKQYEELATIYNNTKIPLIARSKRHYEILKNLWKEPVGIADNCDITQLYEIIKKNVKEK